MDSIDVKHFYPHGYRFLEKRVEALAVKRKNPEQYLLRMPKRLRDRIQAHADRNERSLNSEILRALELAFPEPVSLSSRISEVGILLSALRKVRGFESAIDAVSQEIADVMRDAAEGQDPTLDDEAIAELKTAILKWDGRRDVELAKHKRLLDEKYRSEESDK
ncbi:Arc family DNA-binding protein [Hoeflea sp.]|uniref:Arc family DNA-binding protein n=1 Tax=Hoeflea sp. TaxID=1940281 RepID=UPI003B52FFFA